MKNIRIWYNKDFECRYISHLDVNRCMLRALHKSKIPIWHTEGFNPHPFATFPLPLSLGFRGINECMDVKLEDEEYTFEAIVSKMNECLPRGIRIFRVTDAIMKASEVAYAGFKIILNSDSGSTICLQLADLLSRDVIEVEKRTKKGIRTVDIKHGIKMAEIKEIFAGAELDVILAAGSADNVNPNLLISAFNSMFQTDYDADITRVELYNSKLKPFR